MDSLAIDKNERTEFTKGANLDQKGDGMCVYLSVEEVDEFHKVLLSRRRRPSTKPQDQPWGNREFILHDPDSYKLVVFKRK